METWPYKVKQKTWTSCKVWVLIASASLPPERRHMCTQHLRMIRHPLQRSTSYWALTNHSGGSCSGEEEGEEMKGNEVSVRLRGHSGEQAQTTRALLYSASTQEKGKGESDCMCKHANTSHIITIPESTFCWHLWFLNPQIPSAQKLKSILFCTLLHSSVATSLQWRWWTYCKRLGGGQVFIWISPSKNVAATSKVRY